MVWWVGGGAYPLCCGEREREVGIGQEDGQTMLPSTSRVFGECLVYQIMTPTVVQPGKREKGELEGQQLLNKEKIP